MLRKLGGFIEKRPWLVVIVILLITFGSASLVPSIEMETATEDFIPDDEIVKAGLRVSTLFGETGEVILIFVENQEEINVVTANALKEQYKVLKDLDKKYDEIVGSISISGFLDILCQIEFGEPLLNCSDEQITMAYNDLMAQIENNEIKMLETDDSNEKIDYDPNTILSRGKNIDSLDIKNYYITTSDETFIFNIEVYDLSQFKNKIKSPYRKINTWEWYINFENLIIPDEQLKGIEYQITAHIEPSKPIWEVGKGIIGNIQALIRNLLNRQLFDSYKAESYLWIKAPDQDISFPIDLNSGNVSFNTENNKIQIEVDKEELGKFGIAPQFNGMQLPAKIGNTKAGVRIYQTPILHKPWNRIIIDINFLEKLIDQIQNRPIINSISEKILSRFGDFTWEDFDEIFDMLNSEQFSIDSISLKDFQDNWVTFDQAPDEGVSNQVYYLKPYFIEDLKTGALSFLSPDYMDKKGPSSTLMMVQLNSSILYMELAEISGKIESTLIGLDSREDYVSMKATGNGIVSNDLNELTEEANIIIMPAIFLVISLILLIMFKRLSYVFLPLVSLSISIIWLFGTMVLLGINFNMMMVAVVPLLMGLGVDYSVHLFHNYRAELKKGYKPGAAIVESINDVGTAMFLATLTTVIAFLSFLSASVPPLRDFGLLCALGIIYTLINALTFQSAVRYLLDRNKTKPLVSKNNNKLSLEYTMEKFSNFVLGHSKSIIVLTVIITVLLGVGAANVETTFDMDDFLPEGNETLDLMFNIGKYFPSASEDQEYIFIEGEVASVETLEGISKTYENLKDDSYVAFKPDGEPKQISIISVIRDAIKDNSSIITDFNLNSQGIPKTDDDVEKLYDYFYTNPAHMVDTLRVLHKNKNNEYDATVMRIYTTVNFVNDDSVDSNQVSGILYNELNEDMESYGDADGIVTGMSSSMYTILGSMTESQILSTSISIILATLVLMIVFKNPILGAIAVIPVGLCIIWIIGTIYLIGYSFNIMTIMVTSLTIGIGIDYAIHTTQRFRLTADRTGDVKKAVATTIGHTGGALFIAALTTAAGFGLLTLAPMPPEQQFGIIVTMTIIYSYISSIIVLPPILRTWGERQKKKKGFIISPSLPDKSYPNDEE